MGIGAECVFCWVSWFLPGAEFIIWFFEMSIGSPEVVRVEEFEESVSVVGSVLGEGVLFVFCGKYV